MAPARRSSSRSVPTTAREPGGAPVRRLASAATTPARIAFALLVLATLAALLIAQHLKHELPLVVADAAWHPTGPFDPRIGPATFTLKTSYDDDLTVSIVSAQTGRTVAVIARDYAVARGRRTAPAFRWGGRASNGAYAPAGRYVVDVHFDRLDRTTEVPQISFDVSHTTR